MMWYRILSWVDRQPVWVRLFLSLREACDLASELASERGSAVVMTTPRPGEAQWVGRFERPRDPRPRAGA